MMLVSELMTPFPVIVRWDAPLVDVGMRLARNRFRHLPVVSEHGELVALVTDHEVFSHGALTAGEQKAWVVFDAADVHLTAADVAGPARVVVTADQPLGSALSAMLRSGEGAAVVVDRARHPVGVITEHDAVRLAQGFLPPDITTSHEGNQALVLPATASVEEGWWQLQHGRMRHLLVVDDQRGLVDILSLRDLATAGEEWNSERRVVSLRGPRALVVVDHDIPVREAAQLMVQHAIGCVPVVDHLNRPVRIITRRDVLAALVAAMEQEALFPSAA